MGNKGGVETREQASRRVSSAQDEVLAALTLVEGDVALEGRVTAQLVDLLVEGLFLEVRARYLDGRLSREEYVAELAELAGQCRQVGLLPRSRLS